MWIFSGFIPPLLQSVEYFWLCWAEDMLGLWGTLIGIQPHPLRPNNLLTYREIIGAIVGTNVLGSLLFCKNLRIWAGGSIFHSGHSELLRRRFGGIAPVQLPFSLQATCCEFTANTTSFILLIVRNVCARPVEHADLVTVSSISPC